MKKYVLALFSFLAFTGLLMFSVSCGENAFSSFGQTGTDEALLFEAKQLLDQRDFTGAITSITSMSSGAQTTDEVRTVKASAFAGLCGFEFVTFIQAIGDSSGGAFFELMMDTMTTGSATKRDNCEAAVDEIEAISATAANRTSDQNMLMALVSLALIGTILNKDADTDDDGSVDGAYDYCSTTSDSDVNLMVASMANTFISLAAVGTTSVANTEMGDLSTACTTLAGETPPLDFCSNTDPDTVSADERTGFRGVLGSNESIGLGTCVNSIVNCAAACP